MIMPYIKKGEVAYDAAGHVIHAWDILESVDKFLSCGGAWQWFICWPEEDGDIAVRCENAHNVGICNIDYGGEPYKNIANVVNRGSIEQAAPFILETEGEDHGNNIIKYVTEMREEWKKAHANDI